MKDLQEKIEKFNEERDWDQFHSPENLAKSICIEAGELLECFQWSSEYDLDEVKEELADVINYCIQMANKLGVDPKQIVLDKMEKTAKKYPVEKAKGKTAKRWMIDEDKMNALHRDEKNTSTLLPLVSACVNHPGFKYKLQELREVGIYQFMDAVQRLQIYESSIALLNGSYSGFCDTSKVDKDNFNFMRDIS